MNVIQLLEQELAGLEHMAKKSKYPDAYSDYIGKLKREIVSLKKQEAASSKMQVAKEEAKPVLAMAGVAARTHDEFLSIFQTIKQLDTLWAVQLFYC